MTSDIFKSSRGSGTTASAMTGGIKSTFSGQSGAFCLTGVQLWW